MKWPGALLRKWIVSWDNVGGDRGAAELVRGAVERGWLEYCRREKYLYASGICGHNRWLRFLNRKLHFSDWLYSKTTKLMLRNVVECEVHREVLETLWHDTHTDF